MVAYVFFDNSNDFFLLNKIFEIIVSEYFDKLSNYNNTNNNKNFYNLVKTFLKVNYFFLTQEICD